MNHEILNWNNKKKKEEEIDTYRNAISTNMHPRVKSEGGT